MYFQIWKSDNDGQWYWRLRAANNEIIAHGEGYQNKSDCQHAIDLVKSTSATTPVREL